MSDPAERIPVSFDTETHRIGPGSIAPPIVCGIFAARNDAGEIEAELLGNHPDDGLEDRIEWLIQAAIDGDVRIVTQNGGYDYAVVMNAYPRLAPLIFQVLFTDGACTDIKWREKLLNLSTSGRLEKMEMPDGTSVRLGYSLSDMAQTYLGLDLSSEKDGGADGKEASWRLNFRTLDGWRADEYPDDARDYALGDGDHTLLIYEAQEHRLAEWEHASVETEQFRLAASFMLQLMSAWGMAVNHEATDVMAAHVEGVMEETKVLLEEHGILRPDSAVGPPYAKDRERAYDLLLERFGPTGPPHEMTDDAWGPYADELRAQGIKFKKPAGKPGSMNKKRFQEYLVELYHRLGEIPDETPSGDIKCDAEVQEYLATKDDVMAQYYERQALSKIKGQMIPMLRSGDVVHPAYDALKETGRTSSYDGGKMGANSEADRVYPSVNIQQIPNKIKGLDPRKCFAPRPGRVFFDVDFTGLELACVGHVTYTLFGESVHRDLYNEGVDLHAYLGAQLALGTDGGKAREFASACRDEGILTDPLDVYHAFRRLKDHEDEEVRGFFKHFRKFAKPVGLGFPGGLGPATMVEFARKTYGVEMTEEQAYDFREMWRQTYPEMPRFFDWINGQVDDFNMADIHGNTLYQYVTPMGMVRRGATFCAAANGASMQSPGAEAAETGALLVTQACYDWTLNSVLLGCRPIAFVHDQVIGETTEDESLWAEQCEEVARLMREGAEMVLDSIKMRTDEALLTTVWTKDAEPVRDENGNLIPWTPEDEQ